MFLVTNSVSGHDGGSIKIWQISKRLKQQTNYDSHGGGRLRPSLQRPPLADGHLHLQDHTPGQRPGGVGVLRSVVSAEQGLLHQSLLRGSAPAWPRLSQSCIMGLSPFSSLTPINLPSGLRVKIPVLGFLRAYTKPRLLTQGNPSPS